MKFRKIFQTGLLAGVCLYLTSSSPAADNGLIAYLKIVFAGSTPVIESGDGILVMHPAYELEYGTFSNRFYQLQGSTNVAVPSSWTNIGVGQMGNGNTVSAFVSGRSGSNQFFRVLVFDPRPGLIAHYKLDGNADDATGAVNNGVLSSPVATTNRLGASAAALHFNGAGDGVVVGDAPQINFTNAFTLSAWVRFESGGTFNPRIIAKATIAADGYQLLTEDTGAQRRFNCTIGLDGTGYVGAVSANLYPAGTWHHVVATFDGSAIRLYINGVADGMIAASGSIKQTNVPMNIGRNSAYDNDYFRGDLDDVRLYNRALSSEEAALLFATQQ